MALSNKEVGAVFKTLAGLLELHGESDFRTKSYANAAFQLGRLPEPVMTVEPEVLEKLPGVGKGIAAKIMELRNTGSIVQLEELITKTPPGLVEILRIKGLGGKKVREIWTQLGIESVGELLYACYENRLSLLKGFGEKTQAAVIQSIEYYQNNLGKFHYASVAKLAEAFVAELKTLSGSERISLCGDIRRQCNVVEGIDMIAAGSAKVGEHIHAMPGSGVQNVTAENISGTTESGVRWNIVIVDDAAYVLSLFKYTGNDAHVQAILGKLPEGFSPSTEEEIYLKAGLPFCIPALRDLENIPTTAIELVQEGDIRGVVHAHSTWSDGKNTLEAMADACKEKGYSYLVISDHSKSAFYAGGLSEERIAQQHAVIDKYNSAASGFKIFKSIECDILNDGSLDYSDDVLKQFDVLIASVHQNLKMDVEKATARLMGAIAHPMTDILGHMTGRLLLSRPGYPLHHKMIIDACAQHGVAIEINANPYRLDIDHTWIPYALEKQVWISINPDAHSIEGIDDIHWGTISARKGGLTAAQTLNAKSAEDFAAWVASRRSKRG